MYGGISVSSLSCVSTGVYPSTLERQCKPQFLSTCHFRFVVQEKAQCCTKLRTSYNGIRSSYARVHTNRDAYRDVLVAGNTSPELDERYLLLSFKF